jgi:hypothetical protein
MLVDMLVVAPSVNKESNLVLEHVIDLPMMGWTYEAVNNSTRIEIATKKLADDNPHVSTLNLENNDPVCTVVVSADMAEVNVTTSALADNDTVTSISGLANAKVDANDLVKVNVESNKLADNDPGHQTDTLKKAQFNALDGNAIFKVPMSTYSEPSATAVKNAAAIL